MSESIPDDIRAAAVAVVDRGYDTGLIDAVAAALMAERERAELKSAQAYQVIGNLLDLVGLFESDEGQRALDYFCGDDVDEEFLPWPNNLAAIRTPSTGEEQ